MIELAYGGQFDEYALVEFIRASGRDYIIQGQQATTIANHTKPRSLDYWLRRFAANPDTKQAENSVVAALVATGLFEKVSDLVCPDLGTRCKGLKLVETSARRRKS